MTPNLSVITGSLNRPDSLQRLVDSFYEHTSVSAELIISDASDVPFITKDTENIKVLPERPRLGCTAGYNRAFREARGKYVIWLNDDATVLPGYDTAAIAFMDAHPEIGLGALYYSNNGGPFHVNSYWDMVYANFGIINREFGERIGWFDEDITMYGCDNSIAFRTLLDNKGIATIPGAMLRHHVVEDEIKLDNQKYREQGSQVLQRKYAYRIDRMKRVYARTAHLAAPMVIG